MPKDQLPVYRFLVQPLTERDSRSVGYLADAHALGFSRISEITCADLYFIEGQLEANSLDQLQRNLLTDPLTQTATWRLARRKGLARGKGDWLVEVALRPGVTDPVAEQIVRAAHEIGIATLHRASTGLSFVIRGQGVNQEDIALLAKRLLTNPVIQRFAFGEIEPIFPSEAESSGHCEKIPVRGLTDEGLLKISQDRRAALDLEEMRAIQNYCKTEGRDLTDIELEMIAQTWSEHCVHKTFKALIEIENYNDLTEEQKKQYSSSHIDNIMRTYLRAATEKIRAPWVRSAFVDNAGILEYDGINEISFKVETHNHPSAIEPFGGANTGVGGVIRDVIGVSARPVAATDVLCFGPQDLPFGQLPEGVLHPRRIFSGVVAGVQDYGNKIGIPTVSGAILYDPGYTSNPLVFCGCVGIAPKDSHPRQANPGDRIIVIGGRTGRDGLRGATFSSMTMDAQTGEVSGASVQIGAPITEKGLIEVVLRARDAALYTAITDCGAGGLSSAVGEMTSELGGRLDLQSVPLKYPGLSPWEVWLSEAQERMVLAVPNEKLPALLEICRVFDVELTDIGAFEATDRLVVNHGSQVVLDLSNQFLHHSIPQRKLSARLPIRSTGTAGQAVLPQVNMDQTLLQLLAHPDIASKAEVVRIYDHEVQGGVLVKPFSGIQNDGPSDGCVLRPPGSAGHHAVVLSNGINQEYGKLDAYRMTAGAIDEAVRNAVAVGADPQRIAILDNFCWGDPLRPETLGTLLDSARACYDTAVLFGTPFISGKDSLNNEYLAIDGLRHAIPPTLLISAIGVMEDYRRAVTMDLKNSGDALYLVGPMQPEWGGSHFHLVTEAAYRQPDEPVPGVSPQSPGVYRALFQAMQNGLVRACHDISEGGMAVAAAEMCIGGRVGLTLTLDSPDPLRMLFAETNGCLLVEVSPEQQKPFEAFLQGLPCQKLGNVTEAAVLDVTNQQVRLIQVAVEDLVSAWNPRG